MLTNINIIDDLNQYKYIVEYIPQNNISNTPIHYIESDSGFVFTDGSELYVKTYNDWGVIKGDLLSDYIPELQHTSIIRLYFPKFSVDTYNTDHKYALNIGTWICGRYISLGNYIISRNDALACQSVKTFFNEKYYECIDLPLIVDPTDLIYSDEWSNWRKNMCGENWQPHLINSVGSNLYCSLHPVKKSDSGYMKLDGYTGAQNSIRLFDNKEEFLNLELTTNVLRKMKNCEHPSFILNLNFNDFYKGSLDEYLLETYGIADYTIKYELVIADEDGVYSMCESSELKSQTSYKFTKNDINGFENGRGWKYGINVIGSVEIKKDQESVMTLISNKLPLSKEIFKYFIKTNYFLDDIGQRINNVNLDNVNMNLININTVNKTENKIVKIDRPVDNKANIYQTLFYRVVDSISITIHPNVNENVCINLDQYKHLVDRFILQIEGVKFIEIGRIKSGIIFKVIGGRLPKKAQTGKYYILNQDFDMVTSGKYIYEV